MDLIIDFTPSVHFGRENVMKNETRMKIFQLVSSEPGIYLLKIIERLQIDSRTAFWHLNTLQTFALIRPARFGNNLVYFEINVDKEMEILYYYLHKNGAKEIFKAILDNSRISFPDLLIAVNMPRSTLTRKIQRLLDDGILVEIPDADARSSYAMPEKYAAFLRSLL